MSGRAPEPVIDLLVVGSGPTGIAIGAAAKAAGLETLLVDRGSLVNSIREFPVEMEFFTTRDKLEIAEVPFAIAEAKPSRRQALAYYRGVAEHWRLPLALREEVQVVQPEGTDFLVISRERGGALRTRRARAVALATGYWDQPKRLGVRGESSPLVRARYREAWEHVGETVVVVGAGNSACEAALDLWRHGARVVLVHRGATVKPSIKFWLAPDIANRIEEGSIEARFESRVVAFSDSGVLIAGAEGERWIDCDAVYVLVGYTIDVEMLRRCGVTLDPETLIPQHDPETCESNVPGLYLAGTLQAGRATDRIFIENSRDHGARIAAHLRARLGGTVGGTIGAQRESNP